ncbi:MAG: ABC transporter permease [Planctomycetota bacterium]|nr:MAG: ABC transporter permease [Planctomycetota bacterium]
MLARALRRLLSAAGLAAGVSLILLLVFDSGLLGDPALIETGPKASAQRIGEARLRLGAFSAYEPRLATLHVAGPPQRFVLRSAGDALELRTLDGSQRWRVPLTGRTVQQALAELDGASPAPGWRLSLTPGPGAQERAQAPASGIAAALRGASQSLDTGRGAELAWAEAVPAWRRYGRRIGELFRGDFGVTRTGQPIGAELWSRARRSLALAVPAFLLSTALALALALWAAVRRGWLDRVLAVLSVAGMSVSWVAAIPLLQRWLAADLRWFPIYGWEPPYWTYLLLPILIWTVLGLWADLRFYRSLALEELHQEYVRNARAQGLGGARVLRRHVLRNILVPVLAQSVSALPALALGSLLIERFFGVPGLGGYTVDAVLSGDQAVLRAVTFLSAMCFLLFQWLADLACAWADPRYGARP